MNSPGATRTGTIVGVGIATLDIVNEVATYPVEDAEVRALAQREVRGGNVTNTLTVLSQLGRSCAWAGTLGDDAASERVLADLNRHGIDTRLAVRQAGGCTPTSYIALSRDSGSRTIVHYRNLAELTAADLALGLADLGEDLPQHCTWVHFEGRNPTETTAMMAMVRERLPEATISLEMEKVRTGGDQMLDGPDLLLFSRAYALALGATDPATFLAEQARQTRARHAVLAWGDQGSYGWTLDQAVLHVTAQPPPRLVDTLGAGDVFNAAVIDGLLHGLELSDTLSRANRLAGFKCGRVGLTGLVDAARSAGFR